MTQPESASQLILAALQAYFKHDEVNSKFLDGTQRFFFTRGARFYALRVTPTRLAMLDATPPAEMAVLLDDLNIFDMLENLPLTSHLLWDSDDEPRIQHE